MSKDPLIHYPTQQHRGKNIESMSVIYMLHLVIDILRFLCKFSSNFIDAFSLKKFKRKLTYKNAYKRAVFYTDVFNYTCSTCSIFPKCPNKIYSYM